MEAGEKHRMLIKEAMRFENGVVFSAVRVDSGEGEIKEKLGGLVFSSCHAVVARAIGSGVGRKDLQSRVKETCRGRAAPEALDRT